MEQLVLSLDLEMNQPSNSIIQIGACIGSLATGTIVDQISIPINAQESLSPYITQLTGLTQEQVDNGLTLQQGYTKLMDMVNRHPGTWRNPLVWGGTVTE